MNSERLKIAKRLNANAQIERVEIFGEQSDKYTPLHYPEDYNTMFAGYIGEQFSSPGAVIFGANPGGGGDQRHQEDDNLYKALREFKKAGPNDCFNEFEAVNGTFYSIVKTWNLWRIFEPTLIALNQNLHEICYLNAVPYRTRENKTPPIAVRGNAWRLVIAPTLAVLKPGLIVCLGKKAGDIITRFNKTNVKTYIIPRTNGDRYISQDAKEVLREIRKACAK